MNSFNRRYKPIIAVDKRFIALHKRLTPSLKRFSLQGKRTIPPANWINPAGKRLGGAAKRLVRQF